MTQHTHVVWYEIANIICGLSPERWAAQHFRLGRSRVKHWIHEFFLNSNNRVPTKPRKFNSMTFPWLSMTKLTIFHDHFRGHDSHNFSREIHFSTISETILSVTIFWIQIRVNLAIFHDHFRGWDSCKFFPRNSSLDNFGKYHISDNILNEN